MAAHFKVSRPVLRQALERLRASGIVTSKRGSGNFVVETLEPSFAFDPLLSIPDVQRCLEFRCAVEAKAAGTAARKRTKLQLEMIEKALHDFESVVASRHPAVEADIAFHMAIADATNNPFYVQTLRALRTHISFGIKLIQSLSSRPSAARLEGVIAEHRRKSSRPLRTAIQTPRNFPCPSISRLALTAFFPAKEIDAARIDK